MINSVTLVGRLTKDPVLRKTNSNKSVLQATIAVNRGGQDDGSDFITIIAWEKLAELIVQFCHKGDQIAVNGRLQSRSWDDNDGTKKYATEVVVTNFDFGAKAKSGTEQGATSDLTLHIESDDLPF